MPPPVRRRGRGKIVRGSPLAAPYGRLGDEDGGPLRTVARSTRRDGCSIPRSLVSEEESSHRLGLDDEFPGIHRPGGPDRLDYTAHGCAGTPRAPCTRR